VPNVQQARKSLCTHMMKLLGDVGHVESHFSPFGDSVNIGPFGYSGILDVRKVHVLCRMYHRLRNHFGST
jgi:hypothetical protein